VFTVALAGASGVLVLNAVLAHPQLWLLFVVALIVVAFAFISGWSV